MNNTKIIVACHKPDKNIRNDDIFMPLQVGKDLHPEIDLGFETDNTGINISKKNTSYCELTALYWAWKNLKNVDVIGLAHYRRYLDINESEINRFLENPGIILPSAYHGRSDNYSNLAGLLTHEDATIAIDTLLRIYPDSKDAIEKYFYKSNKYSVFNMFIADWKTFDSYANFIFPYLEKLELRLQKHSYYRLQRNMGYIAEALLGFWVIYMNLRVKYVPYTDYNTSVYKKGIRTSLRNIQRDLGFQLTYLPYKQKAYYYKAAVNALKMQNIDIIDL